MTGRGLLFGGIFGIGAGALMFSRSTSAAVNSNPARTLMENLGQMGTFKLPAAAAPYIAAINAAEVKNSLPRGLLGRLLYEESRYRQDIITGRVKSPVGALGIAQFMPATAKSLGIDPLDPYQAIAAAGEYLADLYSSVGTWAGALAAYNWGVGNVRRKGLDKAPSVTKTYYTSIMRDVGLA